MKNTVRKLKIVITVCFIFGLVGCGDGKKTLETINLFEKECTEREGKLSATMTISQWNNAISLTCNGYTDDEAK